MIPGKVELSFKTPNNEKDIIPDISIYSLF